MATAYNTSGAWPTMSVAKSTGEEEVLLGRLAVTTLTLLQNSPVRAATGDGTTRLSKTSRTPPIVITLGVESPLAFPPRNSTTLLE
jgi:hypothetical protein